MSDGWESIACTLTLDAPEGYSECPATYSIGTQWDNGRLLRWDACTLDEWAFNGRKQTRATAVALLGEDEVRRQEELAGERWSYENRRRIAA